MLLPSVSVLRPWNPRLCCSGIRRAMRAVGTRGPGRDARAADEPLGEHHESEMERELEEGVQGVCGSYL